MSLPAPMFQPKSPRPALRVVSSSTSEQGEEASAHGYSLASTHAGAPASSASAESSSAETLPEWDASGPHSGAALVVERAPRTSSFRAVPEPAVGRELSGERGLEVLGDAQLVALARAGDRSAFELLYRRHAAFALNLAVRIQGGVSDVEDIVHDAFLRAHDRLDELRDDAAFRGWLGSIVVRLVRSRLRRGRLLGTLGFGGHEPIDLDALAAEGASPEARALLAQIYGVLRRLPVDQRIAWTLRYVEKHTLPDVAQMVGCSLATVKRRVSAAQSAIDVALGEGGSHE